MKTRVSATILRNDIGVVSDAAMSVPEGVSGDDRTSLGHSSASRGQPESQNKDTPEPQTCPRHNLHAHDVRQEKCPQRDCKIRHLQLTQGVKFGEEIKQI